MSKQRTARRSLLFRLSEVGSGVSVAPACTWYDEDNQMTRLVDAPKPFAIDVRGVALQTKKKDMEKGEDQKDRWW